MLLPVKTPIRGNHAEQLHEILERPEQVGLHALPILIRLWAGIKIGIDVIPIYWRFTRLLFPYPVEQQDRESGIPVPQSRDHLISVVDVQGYAMQI
ncbi:MAG: hypothetical protein XD81_1563 [Bacteroidetes bacterium 38_7]|nr:MAG: hypothetical protein XD81_1563 [Bacteroidetes bacterium 38_7]HAL64187.1 hypothetical protein [Bacteroidales bacterium]